MKILVTGVGGQLGHDVMNELARRGHQGVGSDIAPVYSGIADGSAVTGMPYVAMDITNEQQVRQVMDRKWPGTRYIPYFQAHTRCGPTP